MNVPRLASAVLVFVWCVRASHAEAQGFTQRGFVEARIVLFPQDTANDSRNVVLDVLVREEVFATVATWLQLAAGLDLRKNSHQGVSGSWVPDVRDRERVRAPLAIRRLSATVTRGPLTLDIGKQFIRWGKADLVTPTDRFAPKDFLDIVNSEFLAVTGARLTLQANAEAFEVAWVPFFTPSRIPILDQRWTAVPAAGVPVSLVDAGAAYPARGQAGVRWSHMGSGHEYSLSFFDGHNHLPNVAVSPGAGPLDVHVSRRYPALRMYGGDAALPTRWATAKGEAAYFTSPDAASDDYVLYVLQLERQTGEWLVSGGYAGEAVVTRRTANGFAPDRGMTRSVIGRASYTIDPNQSAAIEGAVRDNGDGVYVKGEYSRARGQHWRTTVTGALLAGKDGDFIEQYRRNSHVSLTLRYSF